MTGVVGAVAAYVRWRDISNAEWYFWAVAAFGVVFYVVIGVYLGIAFIAVGQIVWTSRRATGLSAYLVGLFAAQAALFYVAFR